MSFKIKTVESSSELGEWLKKERERRGWTLHKASRETQITPEYLEVMENEEWEKLPDGPSRKKLIQNYIRVLGGPASIKTKANDIADQFPQKNSKLHPTAKAPLSITPTHIKLTGLGLLLLALLVYLGFQAFVLTTAPELAIESPPDGFVSNTPTVLIKGKTDTIANVTINERPILKNDDGTFETSLDLERGTNIIIISARKKHSKANTIYKTILFESN